MQTKTSKDKEIRTRQPSSRFPYSVLLLMFPIGGDDPQADRTAGAATR